MGGLLIIARVDDECSVLGYACPDEKIQGRLRVMNVVRLYEAARCSAFAMGVIVSVMAVATLRVGKRIMPMIFGFTGALSFVTGFVWIHKTSKLII